MAALELMKIGKIYDGYPVVDGISITVPSGEILSLLGPSGCGKSTTLRMVAGLASADEGKILIGGHDVTNKAAAEREIGMVFQSLALFPHMTVAENVGFGLKCKGLSPRDRTPKVNAALERVRLGGFEERMPGQLSGGQRQRVALARAIVTDPKLLLLDEPFSALDRKLRDEMQQEVRDVIRSVGITALFVTHDQEEAIRLSDRIAVMQGGKIIQIGSPRDIYERPKTQFVAEFVGSPNLLPVKLGTNLTTLDGIALEPCDAEVHQTRAAGRYLLNVRPERVRLHDEAPANGQPVTATISSWVYEGGFTTYRVALAGSPGVTWTVREATSEAAEPRVKGQPVFLSWNKRDAHMIADQQVA
jgi:putative spermidine/putrescine transport system ATP-binding protein